MATPLHTQLTRRERQIMDILFRRGRATAAEVMEELPGEPSYSTVRTQLRVLELTDDGIGEDYLVPFADPVYTVGASSNPEFHQPRLRLGYTTMATPPAVYDYDVATRELIQLKQTPVLPHPTLGAFDPSRYEQHRTWATAEDGMQVPVSLVCPAGTPRDGSTPFVLYGYGSYEESIDPYFTIARLSLLDRGVGFAIAHVRGGGEMGRRWYDDGKMMHKTNTFTDFVACARHLVAEGWTAPDRLVAEGGSAGGLLVGAVMNLRPDLYDGPLRYKRKWGTEVTAGRVPQASGRRDSTRASCASPHDSVLPRRRRRIPVRRGPTVHCGK